VLEIITQVEGNGDGLIDRWREGLEAEGGA